MGSVNPTAAGDSAKLDLAEIRAGDGCPVMETMSAFISTP